jgi:1,4-alpha-glucan branching enzyme
MLKKRFLKTKCKVTFETLEDFEAKSVALVGDFNNWEQSTIPMKRLKSGGWKTTVNLDKDSSSQFRYLIDGVTWENDQSADGYVPNNVDGDNSVVVTRET